ncbi:MAG: hypothetical protein FWE05_00605 [Defluviitaleaceae bacterium]|nr:hypothetical protein [Defluviitaleaceae bacterium]
MDMNSVNQLLSGVNYQPQQQTPANQPIPSTPPATAVPLPEDVDFGQAGVYTPSNNAPESFRPDPARVREMWNQHQAQADSFRRMIETLFNQQADRQNTTWNPMIEVTPEMRAEAQAMIDEGGYFSVEETAARMLDFAVALTGGDPGRIELMRDAVERGFREAERMWGGELPQISHDTREAVMNGFDEWAAAGSASAISLLNR